GIGQKTFAQISTLVKENGGWIRSDYYREDAVEYIGNQIQIGMEKMQADHLLNDADASDQAHDNDLLNEEKTVLGADKLASDTKHETLSDFANNITSIKEGDHITHVFSENALPLVVPLAAAM